MACENGKYFKNPENRNGAQLQKLIKNITNQLKSTKLEIMINQTFF